MITPRSSATIKYARPALINQRVTAGIAFLPYVPRLDLCTRLFPHLTLHLFDEGPWQTDAGKVPNKCHDATGEHDGRAEPHQVVHLNLLLGLQVAEAHDA